MPVWNWIGVRIHDDRRFLFLSARSKRMFHSFSPSLYLKLFQGIANSAIHRTSYRTTMEYHLLSQKLLKASLPAPPPEMIPSLCTPAGVTAKKKPFNPSLYGPMFTPTLSLSG